MKNFSGLLEAFVPFTGFILIFLLLDIFLGLKAAIIITALMLFIIGMFLLKSENFYKKYVNLLFGKENYEKYIEYKGEGTCTCSEVIKEQDRHTHGRLYIIFSVITLIDLLNAYHRAKNISDAVIIKCIYGCTIWLLSSIISLYFYRKFKNSKQYIFSFFLMIAIFIIMSLLLII